MEAVIATLGLYVITFTVEVNLTANEEVEVKLRAAKSASSGAAESAVGLTRMHYRVRAV
jgi:hypothetical protein